MVSYIFRTLSVTNPSLVAASRRPNIVPQGQSILYREIQALALKSSSVRRMDFSDTLPTRRPNDMFDVEGQEVNNIDPGCEIVAALLPLCADQLTRVTWIILNGVKLGETDLDEMSMLAISLHW